MNGNAPDFETYQARYATFLRLTEEAAPANKAALFEVLTAAGIHTVGVMFDGSGDAGQIESIHAFAGQPVDAGVAGGCVSLPAPETLVPFSVVDWERMQIISRPQSARDVIETMAYSLLEQTHAGWENNDGAYGQFTFTVGSRTITLEYNERHMESDYHEHEF